MLLATWLQVQYFPASLCSSLNKWLHFCEFSATFSRWLFEICSHLLLVGKLVVEQCYRNKYPCTWWKQHNTFYANILCKSVRSWMTVSIYINGTFHWSLLCRIDVITMCDFISWTIIVLVLEYDRFILIASWEILKFWSNWTVNRVLGKTWQQSLDAGLVRFDAGGPRPTKRRR